MQILTQWFAREPDALFELQMTSNQNHSHKDTVDSINDAFPMQMKENCDKVRYLNAINRCMDKSISLLNELEAYKEKRLNPFCGKTIYYLIYDVEVIKERILSVVDPLIMNVKFCNSIRLDENVYLRLVQVLQEKLVINQGITDNCKVGEGSLKDIISNALKELEKYQQIIHDFEESDQFSRSVTKSKDAFIYFGKDVFIYSMEDTELDY